VVRRICEVQIPITIQSDVHRFPQLGQRGRTAVASVTGFASPGDGGDDAGYCIDPSDPLTDGDERVARSIHGYPEWNVQKRGGRWTAISFEVGYPQSTG
jgi:hypothetical protein